MLVESLLIPQNKPRKVYIYERDGVLYSSYTWDSNRGKLLYTLDIVTGGVK